MIVSINNEVQNWINGIGAAAMAMLTTKATEAHDDDLSTWRDVGKGVYDFKVPGASDYKVVAVKSGNNFAIKAVYNHPKKGGKKKIAGENVPSYGSAQASRVARPTEGTADR